MSISSSLQSEQFRGNQESAKLFCEVATRNIAQGQSVLDLGCGTGEVARCLLRVRPDLKISGMDFSQANIRAATEISNAANCPIPFLCADYLKWTGAPWDVILAESVLHLISAPLEVIARKLAADITSGGHLIATVPVRTLRNRLLLWVRGLWRLTPKGFDQALLLLARRMYPSYSLQDIEDRMPYMRLQPTLFGAAEMALFATAGFTLVKEDVWPDPSLAKPRHHVFVWKKTG